MSDHVVIVTSPDDFVPDSFRFLVFDLTEDQTQIISESLLRLHKIGNVVVYSAKSTDPIEWILDKKLKSDFIIFNAESLDDVMVGYFTAQRNSYYFGILKKLNKINKSAIYSVEDVIELLTFRMENNETV
jgi:hypothetical protein